MSYLEWNIDDADRDYVFEEVKSYDMIEMINLNIRGTTSHYTLPKDVAAGRTVTIRNRDFGYAEEGAYFGVEIILADNTEENSSYYFFFKNQTVSFFFNGTRWFLKEPWPVEEISMNIFEDLTIYGFLDVKDFYHQEKKILFNNLNMETLSKHQYNLEGLFFRCNSSLFSKIESGGIKKHKHIIAPHRHMSSIAQAPNSNHILDFGTIIFLASWWKNISSTWWGWITFPAFFAYLALFPSGWSFWQWFMDISTNNSNDNELSLKEYMYEMPGDTKLKPFKTLFSIPKLSAEGGEETRPKNIQGKFVVKAF